MLLGYLTATGQAGSVTERCPSIWHVRKQAAGQVDALLNWMLPSNLAEPAAEDVDYAALLTAELLLIHRGSVLRKQVAQESFAKYVP